MVFHSPVYMQFLYVYDHNDQWLMQGTPGKTRARPRLLTLGSLFCFMGIQCSMSMVLLQKRFPKELMLLQPLKNIFIYFIRKCIFISGFIQNLHFDFACNLHFCLPFYFKWKAIAIKEQSKDIHTKANSNANEHLLSFPAMQRIIAPSNSLSGQWVQGPHIMKVSMTQDPFSLISK